MDVYPYHWSKNLCVLYRKLCVNETNTMTTVFYEKCPPLSQYIHACVFTNLIVHRKSQIFKFIFSQKLLSKLEIYIYILYNQHN